jgi:hypothetical protein
MTSSISAPLPDFFEREVVVSSVSLAPWLISCWCCHLIQMPLCCCAFLTWCQHCGTAFVCRSIIMSPLFHGDEHACFSAFGLEYSKTVRSFCCWYENANPNVSGKHFVCFVLCVCVCVCVCFGCEWYEADSLILVDYIVYISVYDIFSFVCVLWMLM